MTLPYALSACVLLGLMVAQPVLAVPIIGAPIGDIIRSGGPNPPVGPSGATSCYGASYGNSSTGGIDRPFYTLGTAITVPEAGNIVLMCFGAITLGACALRFRRQSTPMLLAALPQRAYCNCP